jgi:hypothetical protein
VVLLRKSGGPQGHRYYKKKALTYLGWFHFENLEDHKDTLKGCGHKSQLIMSGIGVSLT